jgi:hypothetical protein
MEQTEKDTRRAEHVSECWGWLNSKEARLQSDTYSTATSAIAEMCRRLSLDTEDSGSMDQIYMLGFRLVTVERRLSVRRILD